MSDVFFHFGVHDGLDGRDVSTLFTKESNEETRAYGLYGYEVGKTLRSWYEAGQPADWLWEEMGIS